jgi:DNA-binding GntR family transcriptional regulator
MSIVIDRMKHQTLRSNVTELLREAIINGTLAAGSELNQAQLAEQLGISRGPLREALGQLEQEGLIRSVAYKRVYVTPLTKKFVEELYSLRSVLESFAVGRWIERLMPDELSHLEHIVEEMRHAAEAGDAVRLVVLDLEFHAYIVRMADHALLEKLWKPLEIGVQRCLHTRHRIYRSLEEVVGSHPLLVAAIAARDAELAMSLLRNHILEAGEKICEAWPNDDETFVATGQS